MKTRIGLYRARFRRWLEAKAPGESVGERADCYSCPLATFLTEQGAPDPYVWEDTFTPDFESVRFRRLPRWARKFVHLADRTAEPRASAACVTAEWALKCLAESPA